MTVRPLNKTQGFLMVSVVMLFLVLTVLCGLVLAAFARANDQLLVTIKHHQLEQAAVSSIAALKVYADKQGCLGALQSVVPLKPFQNIELFVECPNDMRGHSNVEVVAQWSNESGPPLRAHGLWKVQTSDTGS